MSNLLFAIALTLVSGHDVAGEMPFAIPALRVSGMLRPAPGHRLFLVTLTVGEEPIEAEDVGRFALITTAGRREPIGAGGSEASIAPFDRIAVGREVGEILPSDSMIVLTRRSADARLPRGRPAEHDSVSVRGAADGVGPRPEAAGRPGAGHP